MSLRKIVQIDEEKCDGCGMCVPECVEGALQIVDGKAKLMSDIYCDGLGACLGHCPQDAITIIEREADDFDEEAVEEMQREKEAPSHSHHAHHGHHGHHQCPSSQPITLKSNAGAASQASMASQLTNWPIQITLAPPVAPYFQDADLLIAADCVPFAYAGFHKLLEGKVLLIGCPKLDEFDFYADKLAGIIKQNTIKSVTVAHMEVPCCFGLESLVEKAIHVSGKEIPLKTEVLTISGEKAV